VRRKLKDLHLLSQNARYMRARQFNRLVENIKRDGTMTSAPLVYRDVVLSGNHRVQAAIKAGILEDDVIELLGEVSAARQLALQLSHNALAGEDDPAILRELAESLDFIEREYSGITDEDLQTIGEFDLDSLGVAPVMYEELTLVFLPEKASEFIDLVQRVGASAKRARGITAVAHRDDWEAFFDTIVRAKEKLNILNTSMAISAVVRLANEALDDLDGQTDQADV
jgi:hypothetical protein